jgi:rhodanese-related sulfurtransferase
LAAADGVLIDIRPIEQRRRDGEIPGAEIVPRNVLEWRLDPASPARLPAVDATYYERPVIVFCDEGYASSLAAVSLQDLGLEGATDLDGGFQAWKAAGLPAAPADPAI